MGCWSPEIAMKAYMHNLQLCNGSKNSHLIEPECIEYISALAAGNKAHLMVHISSGTLSPSTIALAVAAKHTGGRLICIRSHRRGFEDSKAQIRSFGLDDVVEFKLGVACQLIKNYKNIDFAVVEQKVEGCVRLFNAMDMNPSRSVVVVCNMFQGGVSYSRLVLKNRVRVGIKSMILPIGGGMEVTRIESESNVRRTNFVAYEN